MKKTPKEFINFYYEGIKDSDRLHMLAMMNSFEASIRNESTDNPVILITEDKEEVSIPNLEVYVINSDLEIITIEARDYNGDDVVFYYKTNAIIYVNNHTSKYSINDILEVIEKCHLIDDDVILISDLKARLDIDED
jgi:hypothetical protein